MKKNSVLMRVVMGFVLGFSAAGTYAQSDWKENGSTGSCAWSKGNTIAIYTQAKDAKPAFAEQARGKFYWAVEKQGNWIKLRKNTKGSFLNGPVLGWAMSSQLDMGPFRNCTLSQ